LEYALTGHTGHFDIVDRLTAPKIATPTAYWRARVDPLESAALGTWLSKGWAAQELLASPPAIERVDHETA
jgi:hypothetical protein